MLTVVYKALKNRKDVVLHEAVSTRISICSCHYKQVANHIFYQVLLTWLFLATRNSAAEKTHTITWPDREHRSLFFFTSRHKDVWLHSELRIIEKRLFYLFCRPYNWPRWTAITEKLQQSYFFLLLKRYMCPQHWPCVIISANVTTSAIYLFLIKLFGIVLFFSVLLYFLHCVI